MIILDGKDRFGMYINRKKSGYFLVVDFGYLDIENNRVSGTFG